MNGGLVRARTFRIKENNFIMIYGKSNMYDLKLSKKLTGTNNSEKYWVIGAIALSLFGLASALLLF